MVIVCWSSLVSVATIIFFIIILNFLKDKIGCLDFKKIKKNN